MKKREEGQKHRKLDETLHGYPDIFNFSPVGQLALDNNGHIHEINLTGAALLGIERTRLIGKPFSSFIDNYYSKTFETHLQQCRQANDSVTLEVDLLVEGGASLSVKLISRAYQASVQQPVEYGIVIIDIPKVNKFKEVKPTSEEFFRTIVENVQDFIFIIDKSLCVEYVNYFGVNFLGLTQEEVIGKPLEELFPQSIFKRLRTALQMVFDSGKPLSFEDETEFPEQKMWLNTQLIPLKNSSNKVKTILGISRDITNRKQVNNTLRDSEERYKKLAEASFEGIAIHEKGKVLEANLNFANMFGYEHSEIIGMHALDFVTPESRDKVQTNISSGFENPYQVKGLRKDGSTFPMEIRGKAIPFQGRTVRVAAIRDISKQKQLEDALRLNEFLQKAQINELEHIYNTAPIGLALVDTKMRYIRVNNLLATLNGKPVSKHIGLTIREILPQIGIIVEPIIRRVLKTGEPVCNFEIKKTKPNNPKKTSIYLVSFFPFKPEDNTIRGVGIIVQDITERKQAQIAQMESENRNRFLVESINDGLVQIDSKSVITYVNSKMCKMIGYNESDLIGKLGFDFVSGNKKEALQSQVELRKKGIEQPYEFEVIRKDGTKVIILVSPKSLFDEDGNYTGSFSVCKDITDRKRAEEIIKASLKEKEVLLKEIHHRVKNNLQNIISLLEIHSNYIEDKKANELFLNCQKRIKTIAYLHEHLYQSNELAKINFRLYIQNLINYLIQAYEINSGVIKLKSNVDEILLDVKKAVPCGLIINELVSNALKYAFPEGRAGDIGIEFRKINHGKYMLTVEDNGIGFPKDIEFKNTDSLGLQLVLILVKQLDGDLQYNGGCGTEVKITFSEALQNN